MCELKFNIGGKFVSYNQQNSICIFGGLSQLIISKCISNMCENKSVPCECKDTLLVNCKTKIVCIYVKILPYIMRVKTNKIQILGYIFIMVTL
jgi:hypothetical protein